MPIFRIYSYYVSLGPFKMVDMNDDPSEWAIGGIRCRQRRGNDLLDIFFMPEGVALSQNTSNGTWHRSFRPVSELSYYTDLLRNEKPLWMNLDPARPERHRIYSGQEQVGEGE